MKLTDAASHGRQLRQVRHRQDQGIPALSATCVRPAILSEALLAEESSLSACSHCTRDSASLKRLLPVQSRPTQMATRSLRRRLTDVDPQLALGQVASEFSVPPGIESKR